MRVVVPVVLVVALLVAVWVLGITGWGGGALDGSWRLRAATVDGTDLARVTDRPVTLVLESGALDSARIETPCNALAATVTGGSNLIPGGGADIGFTVTRSTLVACDATQTRLEQRYREAFERITHGESDSGVLTLTGPGVVLVFDAANSS